MLIVLSALTAISLIVIPNVAYADEVSAGEAIQKFMESITALRGWNDDIYTDLDDVIDYIETQTRALSTTIRFKYSGDALCEIFEDDDLHYDLIANIAGVISYSYNSWRQGNYYNFVYEDIEYPAGYYVANMALNGDEDQLDAKYRQMLNVARTIASDALAAEPTELGREIYIHDAICAVTEYENSAREDITVYNDTAEGVLLYGLAECDGYADAFYMIGALAGLDIGYQCGECRSEDEPDYGGHIWNTIRLDDKYFFVDVTWDDIYDDEYEGIYSYAYCNVGANDLTGHKWNKKVAVRDVEEAFSPEYYPYTSDLYGNGDFGARFDSANEAGRYIAGRYLAGKALSHIMIGGALDGDAFDRAIEHSMTFIREDWSNVYWTSDVRGDTCVEILFDSMDYSTGFEKYAALITEPPVTTLPTSAPTEDTSASDEYVITTANVNVRTGAGTDYDSLGIVDEGSRLKYLGEKRIVGSMEWLNVEYKGRSAWVSAKYAYVE